MKKGQYFSFDAIIASVIFILLLVSLLSYWNAIRSNLGVEEIELYEEAIRISDVLYQELSENPPEDVSLSGLSSYDYYVTIKGDRTEISGGNAVAQQTMRVKFTRIVVSTNETLTFDVYISGSPTR